MQHAAIAIILSDHDEVLWVKRRDLPVWVLPGGGIDPGETPEQAIVREVLEETGLHVEITRKGAILSPKSKISATTHIFVCKALSGALHPQTESEEVAYFPMTAPPSPHFPLHPLWIKEVLASPDQVVEKEIDEITFKRVAMFALRHPIIFLRYLFKRMMNDE